LMIITTCRGRPWFQGTTSVGPLKALGSFFFLTTFEESWVGGSLVTAVDLAGAVGAGA
jgi:hypothetical protein